MNLNLNNIRQMLKSLDFTSTSAQKQNKCSFSRKTYGSFQWPTSSLYSCPPAQSISHWSLLSRAVLLHDCGLSSWILFYFSNCSFSEHLKIFLVCRVTQDAIFNRCLLGLPSPSLDKVIHLYFIPHADNPQICVHPSHVSTSPRRMSTKKMTPGILL